MFRNKYKQSGLLIKDSALQMDQFLVDVQTVIMLRETSVSLLGVVNGTSKILGVLNFLSDLEISTDFAKSL